MDVETIWGIVGAFFTQIVIFAIAFGSLRNEVKWLKQEVQALRGTEGQQNKNSSARDLETEKAMGILRGLNATVEKHIVKTEKALDLVIKDCRESSERLVRVEEKLKGKRRNDST